MQRFVLEANLRLFQTRLDRATESSTRALLSDLMAIVHAELALLDASEKGVRPHWWPALPDHQAQRETLQAWFHSIFDGTDKRATLIDPGPGLLVIDVAGDLELAPGRSRLELVGRPLFEMFPDSPAHTGAPGVAILCRAMRAAAETGLEQRIEPYRHDLADGDGTFVERYWRGSCQPLKDSDERLVLLLGLMENITGKECSSPVH